MLLGKTHACGCTTESTWIGLTSGAGRIGCRTRCAAESGFAHLVNALFAVATGPPTDTRHLFVLSILKQICFMFKANLVAMLAFQSNF
jgi:hypothetical protein